MRLDNRGRHTPQPQPGAAHGYFGVAVYQPRHEANIGTLLRSAKTYQAALLATVGHPYRHHASDTCKTPQSIPLMTYATIDDLLDHLPRGCSLVGVELHPAAIDLTRFRHPGRAMYLLGAEDQGLPDEVLDRCHSIVQIPTPEPWSLNVAVAGSLVLDSRYRQLRRDRRPAGKVV